MAKFVPLTREAYQKLSDEKDKDETFSETIVRLIGEGGQKEYRGFVFEPDTVDKKVESLRNRSREHIRRW